MINIKCTEYGNAKDESPIFIVNEKSICTESELDALHFMIDFMAMSNHEYKNVVIEIKNDSQMDFNNLFIKERS